MDVDEVWSLVARARVGYEDDCELIADRLAGMLAEHSPVDIIATQGIIDGLLVRAHQSHVAEVAAYADLGIQDGDASAFVGWLIAQGRENYDAVLAEPDSLAEVCQSFENGTDDEGEDYCVGGGDVLVAAWMAYREATGEDLPLPPDEEHIVVAVPTYDAQYFQHRYPKVTAYLAQRQSLARELL